MENQPSKSEPLALPREALDRAKHQAMEVGRYEQGLREAVREEEPQRARPRPGLLVHSPERGAAGVIVKLLTDEILVIEDLDGVIWTERWDLLELPIAGGAVDRAGGAAAGERTRQPAEKSQEAAAPAGGGGRRIVAVDVREFLNTALKLRCMLRAAESEADESMFTVALDGEVIAGQYELAGMDLRVLMDSLQDVIAGAEEMAMFAMSEVEESKLRQRMREGHAAAENVKAVTVGGEA